MRVMKRCLPSPVDTCSSPSCAAIWCATMRSNELSEGGSACARCDSSAKKLWIRARSRSSACASESNSLLGKSLDGTRPRAALGFALAACRPPAAAEAPYWAAERTSPCSSK